MPRRVVLPFLLLVLTAFTGVAAACGGDEQAASQNVDTLLRQTFASGKKIDSGKLALSVTLDARGSAQVQGPIDISLSGPFENTGDKKLPRFRMALKFSGAGQNIQAGATSTGDKGFVAFQNQEYEVAGPVFRQFRAGFEQAQAQQGARRQSLASLGIDPRKWLRSPRKAGETEVGGEEVIKITGDVDVPRLLDDVNGALRRAGSLGGQGGQLPERLTDAQKRQVQKAVKALDVEIYTGREDTILRRMVIAMDLKGTGAGAQALESAKLRFDLTLTEVNEDQDIEEPENARPFDELAGQLGALGLGGLGAAGGAGSGAGSGSGSGGGSGGAASSEALERYSDCIRAAGSDATEAQKCADLLTP